MQYFEGPDLPQGHLHVGMWLPFLRAMGSSFPLRKGSWIATYDIVVYLTYGSPKVYAKSITDLDNLPTADWSYTSWIQTVDMTVAPNVTFNT